MNFKNYTSVKFMTLDQVTRICNDEHFRGNNGEGKDYFDQRFEIQHRKWELEDKKREKNFEILLREMEKYEN